MKKTVLVSLLGLLLAATASAHVVVKPAQVGIGAFQTFTVGVPSEKDVPTTSLRLVLPDGLNFVSPNVKPGWKVEVKTQATGKKITDDDGMQVDEMKPVEIDWTAGSIPAGQRDEFLFSAQVPVNASMLAWKAYQTYQDGSIVSWDQTPGKDAKTPYSITNVINDLTPAVAKKSWWETNQSSVTLGISILALLIAIGGIIKKPKQTV